MPSLHTGRHLILIGLALLLSACQSPPAPTTAIDITFQHKPVIQLRVAEIDVVEAHNVGGEAPRVDHLYTQTPATLVRQWADDRLKPVGTRGQVTVIVQEAFVEENPREVEQGFIGLFQDEPELDLTAEIKARIEFVNVADGGSYAVDVNAAAKVAVFESATLNERDLAYYRVLELLGTAFDEKVEEDVRRVLSRIIVP